GVEMCRAYNQQFGTRFLSAMSTNLYGPGDRYDEERSHVVPALILRFHRAKESGAGTVTIWGTGTPRREFLFSEDFAHACLFLIRLPDARFDALLTEHRFPTLNIGTGCDLTIQELAAAIAEVVGFRGRIVFDPGKPDGTPRKLLDVSRMNDLGWSARTSL